MPTHAKVESKFVSVARAGEHHEIRATQPNWVLRKKTYKTLPPGIPDYSIGRDWCPAPDRGGFQETSKSRPFTADSESSLVENASSGYFTEERPTVRFFQSSSGVLEKYKNLETRDLKVAALADFAPRAYTAPSDYTREEPVHWRPRTVQEHQQSTKDYAQNVVTPNTNFKKTGITAGMQSCCSYCEKWGGNGDYPCTCRHMPPPQSFGPVLFPSV
mmetsp:Transcript_25560/g.35269  ORF Transcript_25560/g.35269 Transcript_25560/m.35269 type:complete len:216 (-) Transcript_25560:99-746(-)|eukprot:CAMPEP_0196595220 /NCGR_PEP_ID=MMETSP1081-20130531/80505_1 /TAXON_ID=36882 /ORGANISM="Pyramimonas amylifera, Strain CCMP720" /LENGTH=215 /DNA_ID=CAMNT_0041919723 /DNA_START=113 /DNA_END=760 /DNA_ORIENTATION=-